MSSDMPLFRQFIHTSFNETRVIEANPNDAVLGDFRKRVIETIMNYVDTFGETSHGLSTEEWRRIRRHHRIKSRNSASNFQTRLEDKGIDISAAEKTAPILLTAMHFFDKRARSLQVIVLSSAGVASRSAAGSPVRFVEMPLRPLQTRFCIRGWERERARAEFNVSEAASQATVAFRNDVLSDMPTGPGTWEQIDQTTLGRMCDTLRNDMLDAKGVFWMELMRDLHTKELKRSTSVTVTITRSGQNMTCDAGRTVNASMIGLITFVLAEDETRPIHKVFKVSGSLGTDPRHNTVESAREALQNLASFKTNFGPEVRREFIELRQARIRSRLEKSMEAIQEQISHLPIVSDVDEESLIRSHVTALCETMRDGALDNDKRDSLLQDLQRALPLDCSQCSLTVTEAKAQVAYVPGKVLGLSLKGTLRVSSGENWISRIIKAGGIRPEFQACDTYDLISWGAAVSKKHSKAL